MVRLRTGLIVGAATIIAATAYAYHRADRFQNSTQNIPCHTLSIPQVAGAKPLTESICVSVSGEQPQKVGVETKKLDGGKTAVTLFMEWDFDGVTEGLKIKKPDAEPVTLIVENGKPVEVQVRSHWHVGMHNFDECKTSDGKVVVTVTNAFHTPIVMGCDGELVSPWSAGATDGLMYRAVAGYAKLVGSSAEFAPLKAASSNEVPAGDHPARKQPIYSER